MGSPLIHAESSVKKWGGKVEDYMPIHELLDSSGAVFPDLRHRALTHNAWFLKTMLPKAFGHMIVNSDKKKVSVVEIGQRHVLEDYAGRFIPDASDFLSQIRFLDWMDNGNGKTMPESNRMISEWEKRQKKAEAHANKVIRQLRGRKIKLVIPPMPERLGKCTGGRID